MQTGLTGCKTSLCFLIVFSLEHILLEKEAHSCPNLKHVCASPFNGGVGLEIKEPTSLPASPADFHPQEHGSKRSHKRPQSPSEKKSILSYFLTPMHLTYFCQFL